MRRAVLAGGLAAACCLGLAPAAHAGTVCRSVDPTSATDDVLTVCVAHTVQLDESPYVFVDVDCWYGRAVRCRVEPIAVGDPG